MKCIEIKTVIIGFGMSAIPMVRELDLSGEPYIILSKKDIFPTAKEFYEYQLSYFKRYEDKIIDDFVTHIDNYEQS